MADYIREELGFPGVRQQEMVEKGTVKLATGEANRMHWYLLSRLGTGQCGPRGLLKLFRDHWGIVKNHHHVRDRSWVEDIPTLRRPGFGEVFATLVNTGSNSLRHQGSRHQQWFPARMSIPLRAKCCAFRKMQTIDRLYARAS